MNGNPQDGGRPEMPEIRIPNIPRGLIQKGLVALLVLIAVLSSFYTIDPEEAGLVLRFGQYVRSTSPGLHFKMPFGIERVMKVPVQRQLKAEFGFRTTQAGINSQYSSRSFVGESNILTGDLNAAVVEWVVQYRVVDPYRFLFRVRNVEETFRDMSEAVMRLVVGDRTVNEVLTVGRAEIAHEVEIGLQALCDQYEAGIKVEQVVLQDVNPPDPVKPSFNEVNEAQQEKATMINAAQSEYNKVIPKARGQALQTIQEAEGYALERTNTAQGDSARFSAVFQAYRLAPEVTRKRIYIETMNEILPKVERKIVIDGKLDGVLPLLDLVGSGKGGEGQ